MTTKPTAELIALHNADCFDVLPNIKKGDVQLVLVDPPYGTTNCKWDSVLQLDKMWEQLKRVCSAETPIIIFGAEPFSSTLRLSNIDSFKYDWIWYKPKGTGHLNANKQPMRNHEIISVFYGKQPVYNPQKTQGHERKISVRGDHSQTDVYGVMKGNHYDSTERHPQSVLGFSSDTQNSSLHPTQKPVSLCEFLINTYTNEGDTVLDFTMGSGTTGIACINTGRSFIGIEKDVEYFAIAENRIEQHQQNKGFL